MVFAKERKPWARRREAAVRGHAANRDSVRRSCHGLRAFHQTDGRSFGPSSKPATVRCRRNSGFIPVSALKRATTPRI